jgi:hypothetical protein
LKCSESGLFVNFGQFPCSSIRISIPNTDLDPEEANQCGSGSTTLAKSKKKKPNPNRVQRLENTK